MEEEKKAEMEEVDEVEVDEDRCMKSGRRKKQAEKEEELRE